jgi:PAS domain S-box-containing protein
MQSPESSAKGRLWLVVEIILLAIIYLGLGHFGLSLASINKSASAVWPPTGLSLAVLLLRGSNRWPGIFLGAFLVNYSTQGSLIATLGMACGNTLEALIGFWLVRRFANGLRAFERVRDVFRFIFWAAIVSTFASATIGVATLWLDGLETLPNVGPVWVTWWLGDMVSNFVVAPLILVWLGEPLLLLQLNSRRIIEALGLFLVLCLIGEIVFFEWTPLGGSHLPLEYLALPPLLWAAFRFGVRGATGSAFIMSGLALRGTMYGFGPFSRPDANASLLLLQAFVAAIALTALVMASVIGERRRAEARLQVQDAVSRVLAAAPTLKDATPGIFHALANHGGWEFGAIWEVSRTTQRLSCVEVWQTESAHVPEFEAATREITFERGIGLPGRVWDSCKPAWLRDVTADSNFPRASVALKSGLRAGFCFPIKIGREVEAVLECFSHRIREPDENFLLLLEGLGGQLGQFIERKRALAASQRNAALKAAILECALDSIITVNSRGMIIEFNSAAEKTFGITAAKALGQSLEIIIPHRFREQYRLGLARYLATSEGLVFNRRLELSALRADGLEFPVEMSIHTVNVGTDLSFTAYLRDITERRETERALSNAQDQLKKHAAELEKRVTERTKQLQETIQSLDAFCYSIAHDLRAPLRALAGYSGELEDEFGAALGGTGRDYIVRMKAAALRMDKLILDLLQFGRLNTAELPLETVQLEGCLRDALAEVEGEMKIKNAEIELKQPLLPVRANPTVVEQILANLIGNAMKFVPAQVAPKINIWTESRNGMVRTCIQDNGIGIPPQYLDKLFQPFVRLVDDSEFTGTGIGLAIVRKGVERMGGRAGVESQLGKGSCFWIELPGA